MLMEEHILLSISIFFLILCLIVNDLEKLSSLLTSTHDTQQVFLVNKDRAIFQAQICPMEKSLVFHALNFHERGRKNRFKRGQKSK